MDFKRTQLWRHAFEPRQEDSLSSEARNRLAASLDSFRSKAQQMAAEVARWLPQLTDHSIDHLDALWEIAEVIAGPEAEEIADSKLNLNPAEAYVFGGAVLLHDLGNAVTAYPNGLEDLRGAQWDDAVVSAYLELNGRRPSPEELEHPEKEICEHVFLERLRECHAEAAQRLATQGFYRSDASQDPVFLIDDGDLRNDYGGLIGRIAASHHWHMSRIVDEFAGYSGTSPDLPREWTIDALTVACLLRVADAAHLDRRRAPLLSHIFRKPRGESAEHWEFQGQLLRPQRKDDQLVYRAKSSFRVGQREAWWKCFDNLQAADRELQAVDAVLRSQRKERRFSARMIAGVESPQALARHIGTQGWDPVDIRVQITDVVGVIEQFGGEKLYGDNPTVPLREMIANAADAIRARRLYEKRSPDWGTIVVRAGKEASDWWLEVEDNGIGMSEEVLRGPLLDFGTTYWTSHLVRREHPGLLASSFKPTGRFGIGFFSIFMLGKRVQVTSRPYRAAHPDTRVLELSGEIGSRALVRRASPGVDSERILDGGTKVRVWLSQDPWTDGGLVGRAGYREKNTDAVSVDRLAALVARLSPALDVHVECEVGGYEDGAKSAVEPNDWTKLPFDDLVDRVAGGVHSVHRWRETGIQGDVERDGAVVARLGICPPSFYLSSGGALVIGGLSVPNQSIGGRFSPKHHHYSTFEGVVCATEPSLNRADARPILNSGELRDLLKPSLDRLGGWSMSWRDTLHFAQMFLGVGLRPEKLRCFILNNELVSMIEVRHWLRSLREEAILVLNDGFEMWSRFGEVRANFDECIDSWHQPTNSLIVGDFRDGSILPGLPPAAEKKLRFVEIFGKRTPASLAAYVAEVAGEVWNVSPEALLDEATEGQRVVGYIDDELGLQEPELDTLTLWQPSQGY